MKDQKAIQAFFAVGLSMLWLGLFTPTAKAISETWVGTVGSAVWSNTANWNLTSGGPVPVVPGAGDTALFNSSGNGQTLVTVDGNISLGSFSFDQSAFNGATGYDIIGNGITLSANGSIWIQPSFSGIGITETIENSLTLGGNYTFGNGTASSSNNQLLFKGNITNNTASTLNLAGSGSGTILGSISNGGGVQSLSVNGGIWTLSGSNSYTGGTTVGGGTLQLGDGVSANGSVTGNITDNTALIFANPNAQSYAGNIIGSGTLTKIGAGTLTLSGLSNLTSFYVNQGTVTLNTAGTGITDTYGYIGDGAGSNGTATVTSGTLNSMYLDVGSAYGTGALNINGGSVSNISSYLGSVYAGSSGTATITGGTWNNTTKLVVGHAGTGTLNINGGSVSDGIGYLSYYAGSNGTAIVTGGTWNNTSNLYVGYSGVGTLNLSGSGKIIVQGGGGTLSLALNNGSAGTLNLGAGGSTGTLNVATVTGGSGAATVNFNHSGIYTFSTPLTGTLAVNKLGTGTTVLAGSNNYTGATTLTSGTLNLSNQNAVQNSKVVMNGGNLVFDSSVGGPAFTLGGLSANFAGPGYDIVLQDNATTPNAVALTVGGNNATTTYTGALSGIGSLTKTGTGTLTLTGSNSYTGGTTITMGALALDFSQSGALTSNILNNGATGSNLIIGGSASGGGVLLILTGTAAGNSQGFYSVTINQGASAIQLSGSNPGLLSLGAITRNALGTMDFTLPSGAQTEDNGITTSSANSSGSILGGWATVGGGTWATVSGSNIIGLASFGTDYSNASSSTDFDVIASGTFATSTINSLRFNSSSTTGISTTLNTALGIGSGGILITGSMGAPATITGGGSLTSGTGELIVIQNNAANSLTIATQIVDNGATSVSLTKSGPGLLILSGSSSFTGTTTISSGTLQLGDGVSANGSVTGNITDNTALIFANPYAQSYAGAIKGSGSITKTGAGTLTLGGINAATSFSINQGTLTLNNATGSLTDTYGYIGYAAGSNGTTTITSGTWSNNSGLYIGYSGTGTLNSNGGTVNNVSCLYVGEYGTGTLNINGGNVTDTSGYIGDAAGSNGTATVTNGRWSNSSALTVGNSGAGTLNLNGGIVSNGIGYLGYYAGTNGTAVVTSGTWSNSGNLYIGYSGTGTLNLNGGIVSSSNGYFGYNAGSNGTATVTSGTWNYGTRALHVGYSGTGTLNINGGSVFGASTVIGDNVGSKGTATITGGSWNNSGSLSVGAFGKGTLNINGGSVTDVTASIDASVGLDAMATITSGTWNTSGDLNIGYWYGTGTLNINGGSVSNDNGYLGYYPGTNGTATVTGGTWSFTNSLYVGYSGTGTLNINGGIVSSSNGYHDIYLGYSGSSNGTATVTGGTWNYANNLYVGYSGTGTLNLSGTGNVTVGVALKLAQNGGSAGTLNIGAGGSAGTLNATTVTAGAGVATVNFNHSGAYTFAPSLTGTLAVNKFGTGTTFLTGANTFSGGLMVNQGTVIDGNTGALGSGSITFGPSFFPTLDLNGFSPSVTALVGTGTNGIVTNNAIGSGTATLNITGGVGNQNFAGVIQDGTSAHVALSINAGSGIQTLSGNNSYSGGTTLAGGVLSLGSSGALGTSGTISFSGGTLQFSSANTTDYSSRFSTAVNQAYKFDTNGQNVTLAGNLASTGVNSILTKSGAGTLILSGTGNTFAGGLVINGGTVQDGNASSKTLGSGTVTLAPSGNPVILDLNGNSPTVGLLNGLGGNGIVTNNAIGSGTATLTLLGTGTQTFAGVIQDGATPVALTKGGTGIEVLTGINNFTGQLTLNGGVLNAATANINGNDLTNGITFNGGTLQAAQGGIVTAKPIVLSGSGGINTNGNDSVLSGAMSGTGSFTKSGFGTLTLNMSGSNGNSYTGATVVNAGTLLLDFSNMTLPNNLLNGSSNLTLGGGVLSLLGNAYSATSQTLGNLTLTGTAGMSAIVLMPSNSMAVSLVLSSTWTRGANATLLVDLSAPGGSSLSASPILTGTDGILGYALVKDSTGITGFATVSGSGTIVRYDDTACPVLMGSSNDGTTNFTTRGSTYASGTLSWTGTTTRSVNSLILDTTYNGGTIDLGGTSNILTLVSGAILFKGGNDVTVTGGKIGPINSEVIIHQLGTGTLTINSLISGNIFGTLTKDGSGTLVITASNTFGFIVLSGGVLRTGDPGLNDVGTNRAIIFNSGTLQVATGGISTLRSVILSGIGTIDTNGNTAILNGSIIGSGGALVKTGSGTLRLAGPANTFSAGLVINQGAVECGGNGGLGTGNITFGASNTPTLDLHGFTTSSGALIGGTNAIITSSTNNGILALSFNGSTQTFAGTIQNGTAGTVGIAKAGVGIQILTGSNTYTGATTVNAGKLVIAGSINGSVSTVNAWATLASGNNLTSSVGSVTLSSTATGGGTLAPGDSGGIGTTTLGKLNVSGTLNLGTASMSGHAHLAMELGGTAAGTLYDQVAVTGGSVILNDATLDITLANSYTPTVAGFNGGTTLDITTGDRFFLVIGSSSAIAGQFANFTGTDSNLPGYNTAWFNGQKYAISYAANWNGGIHPSFTGGQDIALLAIPEPTTWMLLLGGFGLLAGRKAASRRSRCLRRE